MKFITACFCLIIWAFSINAQTPDDVLAVVDGHNITVQDLPPEIRNKFENLSTVIAERRKELFARQMVDTLLELEAAARKISVEKLVETEVSSKVSSPTDKDVEAIFAANRQVFGDKDLAQVRPQIVAYLRREPEQKALENFVNTLKNKYKTEVLKDVNAPNLKSPEILASIGGKTISVSSFEEKNKIALYEAKAEVFDMVKFALDKLVYSALVVAEAKSLGIESGDLIAREITDKMRDFSDTERETLETALRKRLFAKYKPQILLKEPAPLVLSISTDDDPSRGSSNAPVTVVMFSDFQCSACSAVHPVLQKVLAEYGDKIRFVVRDFPIVTLHENAFQAALAANAAYRQGKFFEYTEILYRNQERLERESLVKYAADLGLNVERFEVDLNDEKNADEIRKDIADGKSYGIMGTPTIFVNGVRVRILSADGFRQAIDKALKK